MARCLWCNGTGKIQQPLDPVEYRLRILEEKVRTIAHDLEILEEGLLNLENRS